jgi:hypothetical protein
MGVPQGNTYVELKKWFKTIFIFIFIFLFFINAFMLPRIYIICKIKCKIIFLICKMIGVATLALGSQPRQRLARAWAKKEAWECGKSVRMDVHTPK